MTSLSSFMITVKVLAVWYSLLFNVHHITKSILTWRIDIDRIVYRQVYDSAFSGPFIILITEIMLVESLVLQPYITSCHCIMMYWFFWCLFTQKKIISIIRLTGTCKASDWIIHSPVMVFKEHRAREKGHTSPLLKPLFPLKWFIWCLLTVRGS